MSNSESNGEGNIVMRYLRWADSRIPALRWYHISLTEISVFAFSLMLIKLIPAMLCLEWHWYGIACIAFAIPVWAKMLKRG